MPVEATVSSVHEQLKPYGIKVNDGGSLTVATYGDNFYVVAPSPAFAVHCIVVIEVVLVQEWWLQV